MQLDSLESRRSNLKFRTQAKASYRQSKSKTLCHNDQAFKPAQAVVVKNELETAIIMEHSKKTSRPRSIMKQNEDISTPNDYQTVPVSGQNKRLKVKMAPQKERATSSILKKETSLNSWNKSRQATNSMAQSHASGRSRSPTLKSPLTEEQKIKSETTSQADYHAQKFKQKKEIHATIKLREKDGCYGCKEKRPNKKDVYDQAIEQILEHQERDQREKKNNQRFLSLHVSRHSDEEAKSIRAGSSTDSFNSSVSISEEDDAFLQN